MSVGSYLELYLAALGWHFYEEIWSTLLEIGLLYIPFIAMAVRAWVTSYEAAGAEGAERNIRAAEVSIATMFTVVMLAGTPFIPLQPSGLVYTRPCSNDAAKGAPPTRPTTACSPLLASPGSRVACRCGGMASWRPRAGWSTPQSPRFPARTTSGCTNTNWKTAGSKTRNFGGSFNCSRTTAGIPPG